VAPVRLTIGRAAKGALGLAWGLALVVTESEALSPALVLERQGT